MGGMKLTAPQQEGKIESIKRLKKDPTEFVKATLGRKSLSVFLLCEIFKLKYTPWKHKLALTPVSPKITSKNTLGI